MRRPLVSGSPAPAPGPATPSSEDEGPGESAFGVFRNRYYRYLWFSSLFAFMGMQMQMVARALLAWDLTHSFGAVGAISLSFGLPMLCLSLIGGSLADRFEKRNLNLISQAITSLIAVATALLVVFELMTFELLFMQGLLFGTASALGMPARQPLMAQVVGPSQIMGAVAMSNAAMNATRLIGPALAGAFVALWGIGSVYGMQAVLYVFAAGCLLFVPVTGKGGIPEDEEFGPRGSMFGEIAAGLRYVVGDPRLRLLNIMLLVMSFFAMPYVMLLAGFVQRDLGQGESAFGLLQSVSGAGALAGSLAVAFFTRSHRTPLIQWLSGLLTAVGLFLLAAASGWFGFSGAIAAIVILGLAMTVYQTLNNSMMMNECRPEFYGRVMSINMLTFSAMPLMAAPLGALADGIGATQVFYAQAAIVAGCMVLVAILNAGYTFGSRPPVVRRAGPPQRHWQQQRAPAGAVPEPVRRP